MKLITNFCILYLLFPTVTSPLPDQGPAADGEEWDSEAFWQVATVVEVADFLEAGADINSRNKDGFTPLHLAAKSNDNHAVITALVETGADMNSRDQGGNTSLHRAAMLNEPAVITALVEAGANPKVKNYDNRIAWDYAIKNKALKGTDASWRLLLKGK